MIHPYIVETEMKIRLAEASRKAERLNRIELAKVNGTYEQRPGWLVAVFQRIFGLPSRIARPKQRVSVSQPSAYPC